MALTRQQKDALIAYRMMRNYIEELTPEIQQCVKNARELSELEGRPRRVYPQPEPIETPEERQRLIALLADVKGGTK